MLSLEHPLGETLAICFEGKSTTIKQHMPAKNYTWHSPAKHVMIVRYVYELGCEWNYVVWQCREDDWVQVTNPRTRPATNNCPGAEVSGVSLLHGNSLTFHHQDKLRENIFRAVYQYWCRHVTVDS